MARAICRWCFTEKDMHKVVTQVAETNARTAAFAAQAMRLETTLREEIRLADGNRATLLRFGVPKKDWAARLAARMPLPTLAKVPPRA